MISRRLKKWTKYIKNVANLFYSLSIPITWSLPNGLTIYQSYLTTKNTTITPFMYSKTKITLKQSIAGSYEKNKQIRAFMPNLIHSLDASSLNLLYDEFHKLWDNTQFYSIHHCFGTTCDKIFALKTILASVYTEIYSKEPYLLKLDENIWHFIESDTDFKVDKENRTVYLSNNEPFILHDINLVINKKHVSKKLIKQINSQNILI